MNSNSHVTKHPHFWCGVWILWLLCSFSLPTRFVAYLCLPPILALICVPTWRSGLKRVLIFMLPMAFGFWLIHGGAMSWLITGQTNIDPQRQAWALSLWLRIMAIVSASQLWMLLIPFPQLIRLLFASRLPLKFIYVLASPLILTEQIKVRIKQIREAQIVRGVRVDGNLWQRFSALTAMIFPLIMGLLLDLPSRSAVLDLKAFSLYPKRNSVYAVRAEEPSKDTSAEISDATFCLSLNKVSLNLPHNQRQLIFKIDELTLLPNEWLFIGGGNGSGKSSLAMLLAGAIPEHYPALLEGKIDLFDKPLHIKTCSEWSLYIQLIQQNPLLSFSGCTFNVYDEIAFGMENLLFPKSKIRQNISAVLKLLDIEKLQNRTLCELSGGEAQKVAIAAALAMEPKLLILDEAFGKIQSNDAEDIVHKIKKWSTTQCRCAVIVLERKLTPSISTLFDKKFTLNQENKQTNPIDNYAYPRFSPVKQIKEHILLEIKEMSFSWPRTEAVTHRQINKNIAQAEKIALLGHNGAGKSTLFRLCGGLLQPDQGNILLDGKNVHKMPVYERAGKIGFLFQDPERQFFHSTVREEILFSFKSSSFSNEEKEHRLQQTLATLGLLGLENSHPLDLNSAQRRMTAIASLDIQTHKLLLLDEPTRELDDYWLEIFVNWLNNKNEAVLMITHDIDLANRLFSKRWILTNGEIEEN